MALWVDLFNEWCSSPPSMQPWVRYDCFLNVNAEYLRVSCADYRVMVVDTLYMWFFFQPAFWMYAFFKFKNVFQLIYIKYFLLKIDMQGLARLVLCFIARDTNLCWQNKWDSGAGWRNKYWYCKSIIFMSFISILKYPKNIGIKIMVLKIKIKNLKKN